MKRPREVVLHHRELVRTALRDDNTLTSLENKLQALKLEQAKRIQPWEIISKPTLLENPVAPNKRRIVAIGLIFGVSVGALLALILDRKSGLVYRPDEISLAFGTNMLDLLSLRKKSGWINIARLLVDNYLKDSQEIALISF